MPNRILREGILDSRAVSLLSDEAQIFYLRLMSIVDDYGRFESYIPLLRARLFPLSLDRWPEERVERALQECSEVFTLDEMPLVQVYAVGGKQYLQVNKFGQRCRTESKYPAPGDEPKAPRQGSVYFIQDCSTNHIKIGYTEIDPNIRMAALQTGSCQRLRLIGSFGAVMREERELHAKFSFVRVSGEWFKDDPQLMEFIASKCAQMPANAHIARATNTHTITHSNSSSEKKEERTSAKAVVQAIRPPLEESPSQRFSEFWERYPVKENRPITEAVWTTVVTRSNEAELFACLDRYLASDRASKAPKNPANWLHDCARDKWESDWPRAPSTTDRQQARREEFFRGTDMLDEFRGRI